MTATIALPTCATNERKGHAAKTNATLLEIIDRYRNRNNAKNGMHLELMVHEALVTPPLSSGPAH